MHPSNRFQAEDILIGCVHDLRQPLGTIETSVYLLNLLLGNTEGPVQEHLRTIERQVELAAVTMNEAVAEMRRVRAQRPESENLDFTKLETAAVT